MQSNDKFSNKLVKFAYQPSYNQKKLLYSKSLIFIYLENSSSYLYIPLNSTTKAFHRESTPYADVDSIYLSHLYSDS